MAKLKSEEDKKLYLRINTKKYQAVPLKDVDSKESFTITTAKKSRIKTKVRCEECGQLYNQNDLKLCVLCSKKACFNCVENIKGAYYCRACL